MAGTFVFIATRYLAPLSHSHCASVGFCNATEETNAIPSFE